MYKQLLHFIKQKDKMISNSYICCFLGWEAWGLVWREVKTNNKESNKNMLFVCFAYLCPYPTFKSCISMKNIYAQKFHIPETLYVSFIWKISSSRQQTINVEISVYLTNKPTNLIIFKKDQPTKIWKEWRKENIEMKSCVVVSRFLLYGRTGI